MSDRKPQFEDQPQDGFDRDLHRDPLAGQNIGAVPADAHRSRRTAYDVKQVHRALADWPDDELKAIPVVSEGTALEQGAKYINLRDARREEITAVGGMRAGPDDLFVPKSETPYPAWNRLRGIDDPNRTGADPYR